MAVVSPLRRVELRTATDGGGSKQKRCLKASTLFCKIEAFKLAGLVLPWTAKLRTATDGSGSMQKRCLKASTLFCKIEAFKTRRFGFAMDGKTQNCHGWQWFHAETMFKSTNFFQVLLKLVV
ncbi:hypothetical protein [Treponema phagedenis]|uniref:hypothetical protein n=1 Tax=Treponema phagedenis TaxID=162 RepID=UPI0005CBBC58|nr:hypothetical protein [Treponema phagedenis]